MPRSDRVRIAVSDEHVAPDDTISTCQVVVTFDDVEGNTPEMGDVCVHCGGVFSEQDQDRVIANAADKLAVRIAEWRRRYA